MSRGHDSPSSGLCDMLPAGHPHGACGVLRKEAHRCPLAAGVLLTPRKQTAHTCRALGMGRSARMAVCTPSVRARLLRPVDFPPQTTSRCSQGESLERLKAESTDVCQRGPRKQPTGSSASAGERPRGLSEPRPAAQASPSAGRCRLGAGQGEGPAVWGLWGQRVLQPRSTWPPSSVSALCGLLLGGGHSALPTPLCRHSGAGDGVPCVGPAETLRPGSPALCTPTARLWGAMHPGRSACPWVTGRCLPCPPGWPEVCDSGLVTQFHAKLVGPAPRCNRTLGVARPRGAARWWSWLPRSLVASVSLPLA